MIPTYWKIWLNFPWPMQMVSTSLFFGEVVPDTMSAPHFFSGRAVTISYVFPNKKSPQKQRHSATKEEAKKMTRKYSTISTQDKPSHNHQAPP
jgi:hypothetical protein